MKRSAVDMLNVQIMRYFISVIDEGSIQRAGRKLNVPTSIVSAKLRYLEEFLNAQLLVRGRTGITPTDLGKAVYDLFKRSLTGLEEAVRNIAQLRDDAVLFGTIRFGITSSLAKALIPSNIPKFLSDNPGVEVIGYEGAEPTLLDWLEEGRIDVAIGAPDITHWWITDLLRFRDPVVLYSGRPFLEKPFARVDSEQLRNLKLVRQERTTPLGQALETALIGGAIDAAQLVQIDGLLAAVAFIRDSSWCGIGPASAVLDEVQTAELHAYPIDLSVIDVSWKVVRHTDRPLSEPATVFLAAITDAIAAMTMRWDQLNAIALEDNPPRL